jgi:predicted ferric reductase
MSYIPRRHGLPPALLGGLYALVILLPLLIAWLSGTGHHLGLMRAGAACGMAAAAMILLQMVSSGRFEAISGRIGIDITMAFHKWAAPAALALALLHLFLLIGPPDPDRPHRLARRLDRLLQADLAEAWIALALLALLVVLALFRDRLALRYEAWRASHGLGALALIVLLIWHIATNGRGGAATIWLWLLLALAVTLPALSVYARRLAAPASGDWTIAKSRRIADRLWQVTLAPPPGRRLDFRAGQFAWLAFEGHRLPLYDHPFSIASNPGEPQLHFLIQEAGDFTRRIGALPPGTRVALDAPHGSFGLDPKGSGGILLIAGGVGIAPILSVLTELARTGCRRPVRLIYAGRSPEAMLPAELIRPACDTLGIEPLLIADRAAASAGMRPGPLLDAHLRDALTGLDPAKTDVLLCGPGPMMTFATDHLARLGVPLSHIDYERFSYGAGSLSAKDRLTLAGFAAIWAMIAALILAYSLA